MLNVQHGVFFLIPLKGHVMMFLAYVKILQYRLYDTVNMPFNSSSSSKESHFLWLKIYTPEKPMNIISERHDYYIRHISERHDYYKHFCYSYFDQPLRLW